MKQSLFPGITGDYKKDVNQVAFSKMLSRIQLDQ